MATDPRTERSNDQGRHDRSLSDLVSLPATLPASLPASGPEKPEETERLEIKITQAPAREGVLSRIGSGLKRLTGRGGSTASVTGVEAQQKDLAESAMKAAAGAEAIDQLGQRLQQAGEELEEEAKEEALQDIVQTQAQAQILQAAGQQIQQAVTQQQQQLQVQQLQQQAVLQEQRQREERQKKMQKRRATLAAAAQDSLVTNAAKKAVKGKFGLVDAALASFPGTDIGWAGWQIGKWFKDKFS